MTLAPVFEQLLARLEGAGLDRLGPRCGRCSRRGADARCRAARSSDAPRRGAFRHPGHPGSGVSPDESILSACVLEATCAPSVAHGYGIPCIEQEPGTPDFALPATGNAALPAFRHTRHPFVLYFYPQGQHARLHRPRARISATCHKAFRKAGSRSSASRATRSKSHERLQGEDGVSLRAAVATPTRSCARSSASSR